MITIAYPAFFGAFKAHFKDLVCLSPRAFKSKAESGDIKLVVFSGGEDINPSIYRRSNIHSSISVERDAIEIEIYNIAKSIGIKMLGICRGHQLLNALNGAVLVQDLALEIGRDHKYNHELEYTDKSFLDYKMVNSMHHQGLQEPGKNFIILASHQTIIEATVAPNIISVQFHPEFMPNGKEFFNYINQWIDTGFENSVSECYNKHFSNKTTEKEIKKKTARNLGILSDREIREAMSNDWNSTGSTIRYVIDIPENPTTSNNTTTNNNTGLRA